LFKAKGEVIRRSQGHAPAAKGRTDHGVGGEGETQVDPQLRDAFIEKNLLKQQAMEDRAMPQIVEAVYHDGIVELRRKPTGIWRAKALVIFLDAEEADERHPVDLERVRRLKSSVDQWIGVIEGVELGDWKAERRATIEGKPRESAH
jgi:hypothetical protein